ncbi:ABC transporter permease [Natronosalvus rutilus]|uniref:ABC transporter permease n=1 Tax=Natronosalvus rutilus TaxID=2953753 RepID=A0A9E7SX15_9EURY|nr:ABC transporter permease [Natronosalvus rutilus]UTF55707.1 ABC transporter permease [Natronosalvus rutilus]
MDRTNYLLKRLASLIPVFIGVTLVVFLLVRLTPGDPTTAMIPPQARTPETVAALRARLGLDDPLPVQYLNWLTDAITLDLGMSYSQDRPVTSVIAAHIWPTIQIAFVAFIVSILIAVPLGVLSGVYKDSWIDQISRVIAFTGISIPSFWLGLMTILFGALFWNRWFGYQLIPAGGYVSPFESFGGWLWHVLPPGIILGVGFSAITMRLTRSSMAEAMQEDYIRTARSKGAKEQAIIVIHALRNALIPVVTVAGLQIGYLLNGAVVVEEVFAWPGVGRLLFQAVQQQDMPLIQGLVLLFATVFVVMNLVVDLLYTVLDPRIEYE